MKDLIKIMKILTKYGRPENPITSDYDLMSFNGFDVKAITKRDVKRLNDLKVMVFPDADEICMWICF